MAKSIIDNTNYCYICARYKSRYVLATETHHCLGGNKRDLADKDGLTVRLCNRCHRKLHDNSEHFRDLQQIAEKAWLEHNNATIADFIARYGKNFL